MICFKKIWPYLLAIAVFAIVACTYMSPVLEGKIIATSDGIMGRGAVHESVAYHEQTGDYTWWTGSMFSGMPNYQIGGGRYLSATWMRPIREVLLWGHRNVIAIVLIYCLCFFILMRSMKIDKWLSIVGALAIAFSSYFFIIIGANHHSKTSTLALMAAVIAGFYCIFHDHRKIGICLAMVGTAVGFFPHPQMSYYMCFIIGFFWIAELCSAVLSKCWKSFVLSTVIFAAAFGIGLGTGTAATFSNLEYAQETMRGGHSDLEQANDVANKTQGLDLDYATAWSYGIDECWTFIIPNSMGGSSNYALSEDSELCKEMIKMGVPRQQARQFCESVPTYWGTQPFTAGPVYMGIIVCMLFLLGLMVVKGPYKWALLAVTLLSVVLSWGNHWMDITRFFFTYVPMYNKFRAVSSILVIAEVTMPLLGFLAIQRLVESKREGKDLSKLVLASSGIVILLVGIAKLSISGFTGAVDAQMPEWLVPLLVKTRQSMFNVDCLRAIGFVVVVTLLLYYYCKSHKLTTPLLALCLGILVLADMWGVDKRYMNDGMFSAGNSYEKQFKAQNWERQILEREGMKTAEPEVETNNHFRVFNVAQNPFNDARTSYRLKSIGGYSAAKLRRYQDLIDQHLSKMHMPVINMLNARYIITQGQEGGLVPQFNPEAMGNAWFVDDLKVVDTPNEECDALMKYDLHHTAIVDKSFSDKLPNQIAPDSTASVKLLSYSPNELTYQASCTLPGVVVFSEIYYPYGWQAYVDGKSSDHYRVNYMLRALNLESGKHEICFKFQPESVAKGNMLSMVFVILMYLVLLGCIVMGFVECKNKRGQES